MSRDAPEAGPDIAFPRTARLALMHGAPSVRQAALARQARPWILLAPVILLLGVLFLVPLGGIVILSFQSDTGPTLSHYVAFLADPFYRGVLGKTLSTAFIVTCFCLLLGYPVAYAIARYRGTLANILLLVVTMSFWTSFLVRTYAWMVILGTQGPVTAMLRTMGLDPPPKVLFTGFAATIGMIHLLLPFMILSLYAVMQRIDASLLRAAAAMGAGPFAAFRTVFLPLSIPGAVNGVVLVFIVCLGFYVTPQLLGGPQDQMIARLIGSQIEQLLDWQEAATMAVVLLVITLGLFAVYDHFLGLDRLWRS